MGIYNTNQQWTTYRILDATILDADVAAAADIGVGKLNHTAVLTDNNSGAISWVCADGSTSAGAAGGITTGAGNGSNNVGGTLTLTAGASVGSGTGAKVDINAGATVTGTGGAVEITAGGGGTSGAGGGIDIDAGAGGSSSGNGGAVAINSGAPTSGTGGAIGITASAGVGSNNVGGTVTITAGASAGSGTGGNIQLTPGDSASGTAGSVVIGADTAGHDLIAYGATTGNYLQWSASADDLLLVGTATQLGIAGTTASSSTTTGSIHTAGGIGVGGSIYVGGRIDLSSATLNVTDNDVSFINIGSYDTALANTTKPTANTFGTSIHISHATNADSAMWLTASYEKLSVITNAQGNNSLVTSMVRMDIQQAIAAAYGIQSHVKFTAGTAQDVSSEVIAVSAQIYGACAAGTGLHWGVKSDLRATNTPTARGASATFFGVTTVSAGDIVYLENLTGATVQDGLYIHNVGTMTNGIYILGAMDNAIDLQAVTMNVADDDTAVIRIGGYDTALANATELTDNTFGLSIHIDNQADPTGAQWLAASYQKITVSTADQSNLSFVTNMIRADIGKPITAGYGMQSHVKFSGTGDVSSEVIGVSAQIYGAASSGTGYHWGVKSDLRHTNCPSGAGHTSACFFGVGTVSCSCGVYLEPLATTTMYSGIYLHAAGDMTNCIETNGEANMTYFLKAAAAAGYIDAHAAGSAASMQILIDIAGSPYAIDIRAVGT